MSADTLIDKLININAPCQNKPANVIYQILAERFSQKDFDRITEFNFPNFVWDNDGANSAIVPDFLNKGPIASNGSLIKVKFLADYSTLKGTILGGILWILYL